VYLLELDCQQNRNLYLLALVIKCNNEWYVVIKAYKLTVFEILRNFFVLSYIACPCYPYTRVYDKDHAAHVCEFDAKVSFIHESACLLYKVQGSLLYHLKCTQRGMAVLVCAHGIIHPF